MTSKVLCFQTNQPPPTTMRWIHCSHVTCKDGVWKGVVINGEWHLTYNEARGEIDTTQGIMQDIHLMWACDTSLADYSDAIDDARKRMQAGEPSNLNVSEARRAAWIDDDDEVPF